MKHIEIKSEGYTYRYDFEPVPCTAIRNLIAEVKGKEQVISDIKAELQKHLGSDWSITRLTDNYMEIGVLNPEKENNLIFGQTAEIYFERCNYKGCERFEINFGSCGSHELLLQQTAGSFASFFIGIGRLHADTDLLSWLKDTAFGYADRCKELRNEYNSLEARRLQNLRDTAYNRQVCEDAVETYGRRRFSWKIKNNGFQSRI